MSLVYRFLVRVLTDGQEAQFLDPELGLCSAVVASGLTSGDDDVVCLVLKIVWDLDLKVIVRETREQKLAGSPTMTARVL